ncbi:MAG: O-antigen ligase family protein [Anaerolineae bacterium]|nr:O-antigen ligase family protein [Anaerolineae bacterium]
MIDDLVKKYQISNIKYQMLLVAVIAVLAGVMLAHLPLLAAGIGLLSLILIGLALIYPLAGLGATLFFATFKPLTDYFVPDLPLDIGQIALIVTLGSWFLHAVRRRRLSIPSSPPTVPLLVFLGAAALSLPGALSAGYALKEIIKWGQLLIVMWLVIDQTERKKWQLIVGFVLAAAAFEAAIGVWQFARGDGPEHFLILGRFYRAYGTFEQPNPYAGFLGLVLPVSIGLTLGALAVWFAPILKSWQAHRWVKWGELLKAGLNKRLVPLAGFCALSGLLFAALIMSWSRGAWLGFGAAALVIAFAWPRKAWMGAALVIGGLVLGILALRFGLLPAAIASRLTDFTEFMQAFDVRGAHISAENYSVLERLAHWQTAQEMARYHFWVGIGLGNYEPVYPGYALMNWPYALGHAHNTYLNFLAETGIIGLAAYLVLWGCVFWQTWRVTRCVDVWQRSLAVGLLGTWTHLSVHHMVDNLYVANIHLHLGALLGVLSVLLATRNEQRVMSDELLVDAENKP